MRGKRGKFSLDMLISHVIRQNPAMTSRSGFFSIAATHFHARSEAVIHPRVLRFSAWSAGLQARAVTGGTKTDVVRAAAF
jgi:hypothetical protein